MTAGRAVPPLVAGGAVALVALVVVGLPPLDVAIAAMTAVVLVLAGRSVSGDDARRWPAAPHEEADGARSAVATLMWSFAGRDGKVSEGALRQLRRQAGRRLAREGVVLEDGDGHLVPSPGGPEPGDDLRARAILGDRAWRVLTSRGDLPPVSEVAHCIDVIERLAPSDVQPHASPHASLHRSPHPSPHREDHP